MNTPIEKQNLVIKRVLDAPVEQAWKAWTESDYVQQWWGPTGFTCSVAGIDFRAGGTALVGMHSPEHGEYYSTWRFQKIVPLQRIEYIHNLADEAGNKVDPVIVGMPPDFPQDQRHVVVFKALNPQQTELTITEYDWTVGQMVELSEIGMNQCLDKMTALLTTGEQR